MTSQVVQTILNQLGGSRFLLMTGAHTLVGADKCLGMKLPARFAIEGINYVQVKLESNDLYTVAVYRLREGRLEPRGKRFMSGVYADKLRAVFTELTGLETSLGTCGAAS